MQGRKVFVGKVHQDVRLEALVRPDHEVRKLARVLDLSWVYEATAGYYSHTGQPSLDPVVAVKLLLLGLLDNVPSERRLMKRIADTPAYRWYIGYDLDEPLPDHSDLSKFRRRLGLAFFAALFVRVVGMCEAAGLIKNEAFLMDSTLVKADAATDTARTLTLRSRAYWEHLEQAVPPAKPTAFPPGSFCPWPNFTLLTPPAPATVPPVGPAEPRRSARPAAKAKSIDYPPGSFCLLPVASSWPQRQEPASRVSTATELCAMGQKRPRPARLADAKRSATDPDATLLTRLGYGSMLGYKVHLGADSAQGIVTAVAVSPSATDDTALVQDLLGQHTTLLGRPAAAVADGKYGSQDALGYLQRQGIRTVIPVRTSGNRGSKWPKERFRYDATTDTYTCPAGQRLVPKARDRRNHKVLYRGDKATCRVCPHRTACVAAASPQAARTISRFDTPYAEQARRACQSGRGKALLRRRQTCLEGINAEAKTHHGLGRARWRGLRNLAIQALLTATILNLKKLMAHGPKTKSVGQAQTPDGPADAGFTGAIAPSSPVHAIFHAFALLAGRLVRWTCPNAWSEPARRIALTATSSLLPSPSQTPSSATGPFLRMRE